MMTIIIEAALVVTLALILDLLVGDPRNRFHPTAWIGRLIAKLVLFAKNSSPSSERLGGIVVVLVATATVAVPVVLIDAGTGLVVLLTDGYNLVGLAVSAVVGAILLKTTIAIRGMEQYAMAVTDAAEIDDIDSAKRNLSMIVKRKTRDLDKNHVLSGVLESVSENTVDGVTGPLFYYALFGLPGAFIYRTINTIDSMTGYKTSMFKNVGWFGANCDKVLSYLPARITALVMILAAMILGKDWKACYQIMKRDGRKTQSPNAGYPMAALAGALGTRLEKIDHYILGDGSMQLTGAHVRSAISLMKVTSILFCGMVTMPIIILLSYLGLLWQ